jgi:hypothetical protein
MKKFLKPTRKKLFLSVFLLCIELIIFSVYFLFPLPTGSPLCEPLQYMVIPPDTYQNPSSLIDAWHVANEVDYCNNPLPGIESPLVKTIQYTQIIVIVAVLLAVPYLLSCVILVFTENLKKKKKNFITSSKN